MFLGLLILFVALALSGIAAYYSIIGLTAIFAAAVVPIIVMGGVLEVAKLACTVWLHQNWQRARFIMKIYLVPAVAILMFITSMGIFGFLSKSHIEQSALGTEQIAQVQVIDEKLVRAQAKVQRWNDEIGRLNKGETSGRIDGLISREQERIKNANLRIQPQIDQENAKIKVFREQAAVEVEQQNKRLNDAQKRTSADINLAEKRLAQLDKDVAAYTSQGTVKGGVFTPDIDNVKKGNQLRAQQKPERDELTRAIQQAKDNEIGVASRVQREITNINKRLAEQIKGVEQNVDKIRASITDTIESANSNIAKYTLEAGSSNKNVDVRIKELELNIEKIQPEIDGLREEKFVFEKQYRQFEAEVGPVKYIAQLIYGDNPDQNLLEAAVRWVIILIVAVFDPLAIMMLLAATETFAWRRKEKYDYTDRQETILSSGEIPKEVSSPLPAKTSEQVQENKIKSRPEQERAVEDGPADEEPDKTGGENKSDGRETRIDTEEHKEDSKTLNRTLHVEHIVLPDPEVTEEKIDYDHEYVPNPEIEEEEVIKTESETTTVIDNETANIYNWQQFEEIELVDPNNPEKRAKRIWKRLNPNDTLKNQEAMEEQGIIEELPWQKYIEASDEELDKFVVSGFGTSFPTDPIKGDSFVRVDSLPSKLYRWNGTNWIEIDKNNSDTFANNPEYVQYLIDKLGSGEYDPDLLTDAERLQIESQLKSQDL